MKQLTIREAADFLLRNDNYVLLTHRLSLIHISEPTRH